MARSTKVKDIRDSQKNHGKMEVSKIGTILPGDKNSSKFDADIKLKVGIDIKYGKGSDITEEQKQNRISYVSELVLLGYSERELVGMLTNSLAISRSEAISLCKESKAALSEPWRANFETEVDWHVAIRKRIIRKNMGDGGDDKLVLAAADSLAKVQRVFDIMPILEPEDSVFDAADESAGEFSEIINDIKDGNTTKLEEFKKNYAENDKRGIEFEADDGENFPEDDGS